MSNHVAIKSDNRALFGGHRFQKGQSGNPSGRRPVDKTLKSLAGEYTADAIKTLAEIMKDVNASHTARVSAASALLDRGHGKPQQQLEISQATACENMSDDELIADINAMLAELKGDNATLQ